MKVKHLLYGLGLENYWLNQYTPSKMKDIVKHVMKINRKGRLIPTRNV